MLPDKHPLFMVWSCLTSLTTSVVQFSHLLAAVFFKTYKCLKILNEILFYVVEQKRENNFALVLNTDLISGIYIHWLGPAALYSMFLYERSVGHIM